MMPHTARAQRPVSQRCGLLVNGHRGAAIGCMQHVWAWCSLHVARAARSVLRPAAARSLPAACGMQLHAARGRCFSSTLRAAAATYKQQAAVDAACCTQPFYPLRISSATCSRRRRLTGTRVPSRSTSTDSPEFSVLISRTRSSLTMAERCTRTKQLASSRCSSDASDSRMRWRRPRACTAA